jgi:hypothetical protein
MEEAKAKAEAADEKPTFTSAFNSMGTFINDLGGLHSPKLAKLKVMCGASKVNDIPDIHAIVADPERRAALLAKLEAQP